jgi:hypothetical protein
MRTTDESDTVHDFEVTTLAVNLLEELLQIDLVHRDEIVVTDEAGARFWRDLPMFSDTFGEHVMGKRFCSYRPLLSHFR